MSLNKILIVAVAFIVGCSCNTSRVSSNPEKAGETAPEQDIKTEKDGVVKGEMQDVVINPAIVESVKIYIKDSFPMQVDVYAMGNLPDGCTKISDTQKSLSGDTFKVTIMTERPAHIVCTQALVPFEHTVPLDVIGLKAGTYTVNVNGVRETFTLEVDNMVVPEE
jgi:inhibitor of cysteine peptidase